MGGTGKLAVDNFMKIFYISNVGRFQCRISNLEESVAEKRKLLVIVRNLYQEKLNIEIQTFSKNRKRRKAYIKSNPVVDPVKGYVSRPRPCID
ncbi:MAG: hypothetical protein CSA20_03055 [Deltaproteobacteria bacterium]|nr:MAG: hypothetical protein CSA20_03055 [Deltaproteobacteria bacterium]